MTIIEVSGLRKSYGDFRAVKGIDFTVDEGEVVAVLGPNGAGKTTVLALAATLIHPTRGTVEVLDEKLGRTDVFELRPRIGLASAALAERIPPDERVADVVVTAAYAMTGRWRERYEGGDLGRAQRLLDQLGVDHTPASSKHPGSMTPSYLQHGVEAPRLHVR